MKSTAIFSGYSTHGMTMELAEHCQRGDLVNLQAIEAELADAFVADKREQYRDEWDGDFKMSWRIMNVKGGTYLDIYCDRAPKTSDPRGIRLVFKDDVWLVAKRYRGEMTYDNFYTFDWIVDEAFEMLETIANDDDATISMSQLTLASAAQRWKKAVRELIDALKERRAYYEDIEKRLGIAAG